MIIDRKREEMLARCRERKYVLDKKLGVVRAFLMVPPGLYCIFILMWVLASVLSDATALLTGAGWWGFKVRGSSVSNLFAIIECLWLVFLASGLNIWRTELIRRRKLFFYIGTFFIGLLLIAVFRCLSVCIPPIMAIVAIPFIYESEKLVREDEAMSTLEGYPHFNPTLMRNTIIPDSNVSQETIDNMTPDERIEFERSAYNHRNRY